jgi:hypothetical protein
LSGAGSRGRAVVEAEHDDDRVRFLRGEDAPGGGGPSAGSPLG